MICCSSNCQIWLQVPLFKYAKILVAIRVCCIPYWSCCHWYLMFQTKCCYQFIPYTYHNLNFFFVTDERRLGMDEKPLLVQLNWHMDDREGRFLLRRIDDKTNVSKTFLHTSTSLILCVAVHYTTVWTTTDNWMYSLLFDMIASSLHPHM